MKNILLMLSLTILTSNLNAIAGDYPKTKLEQEMDEMGSFIGTDGLGFTLRRAKDRSTEEATGNINKYIYQATKNILEDAPILIDDTKIGIVISDWHKNKYDSNKPDKKEIKIAVIIKDVIISPTAIEVKISTRSFKDNKWQALQASDRKLSAALESKIIRLARDLYIKDKINK